MKNIWMFGVVGLCLLSQIAFASDARKRPEILVCDSPGAAGPAKHFTLSNFNQNVPETDLDAKSDGAFTVDNQVTTFCANNGCDNQYCFVFFTDDLALAAHGKVSMVRGMMNYFNSDSEWDNEKAVEENIGTANISCQVSKI